jgi:hypothetical protein
MLRPARGGLAPWQERRARELLRANNKRGVALKEVARECGLSVGSCLDEGCEPLISRQDAPPRYRAGRVVRNSALPRARFSRVLGMFSSSEVKVLYPA